MFARIDNTVTATQTGPVAATSNKTPRLESFTLTTLGDGHAVPSIFAATPAASTKVEKLMDTLCGPFRIAILSGATPARRGGRAKDLSAPCSGDHSRVTNHDLRRTNYLDTPVEIKKSFSPSESATSPKTSRYTFDMFGKGDFRA